MKKISTLIFLIFLLIPQTFAAENLGNVFNIQKADDSFTAYRSEVVKNNDIVIIRIVNPYSDDEEEFLNQSFYFMKKHISSKITRITVLWQKNDYEYGKSASVGNIYINDFLTHKMDEKTFKSHFKVGLVEPSPENRNHIEKNILSKILNTQEYKAAMIKKNADVYRLSMDYETALRLYKQAVDINSQDEISLYWIAKIYDIQKDFEKAKIYYKKALEIDPQFTAADNELYELENAKNTNAK